MSILRIGSEVWTLAIGALTPVIAIFIGFHLEQRKRSQTGRAPQADKLLRPPGHSLMIELEAKQDRLVEWILAAVAMGILTSLFLAASIRLVFADTYRPSSMLIVVVTIGLIVGCVLLSFRVLKETRRIRKLKLGMRGEQAVAEYLGMASNVGFQTFHDFPGHSIAPSYEPWNIDHVTVGPRGVFVIETKARRKTQSSSTQRSHVARVSKRAITFSGGQDMKAIEQAERNAKTLRDYLFKETQERVAVDWVVALPGYLVERATKDAPLNVMNPKKLPAYLRAGKQHLASTTVERVKRAIDKICRDVEF